MSPEEMEEAIHEASATGDAIKVKELLEKAPELVHHLSKDYVRRDRTPASGRRPDTTTRCAVGGFRRM